MADRELSMAKSKSQKSLVIVESPAKAKTINRYLGPDFEVKASMGHVRDLPSKGLNVDLENDFEPTYDIMPGKKRVVSTLKAAAKGCDSVYLATDLDREGEAIAWHLAHILGIPEDRVYRVIFNAITKSAIKQAFAEPGRINTDKVMAQQARRILDRIVGYQISPLLWKKVTRGLSAGRVQSVAVKMVVAREREIQAFKAEEYWLIPAVFTTDLNADYNRPWIDFITPKSQDAKAPNLEEQTRWLTQHHAFKAELHKIGDQKFKATNEQEASKVFSELRRAQFKIAGIDTKESLSRPSAPFITSTLQQAGANRLGFSAKRTMSIAQQLYEGIDMGSMGSLGLITYMRTDSTHLSGEAIGEARNFIQSHFGSEYLPEQANVYTSKKTAQQAHEAIRPTDVDLTPDEIREFLTPEQYKLYDMIWRRFIACQMQPARWNVTTLDIEAPTSLWTATYKASGRVQLFDGFMKVWPVFSNEQELPGVEVGVELGVVQMEPEQHFTKPPARYTEASLIKALEKEGIGRPSTYAPIISTIEERGYVEQKEKKFHATDLGEIVTDKLNEYFPRIMDIAFTRHMEELLDQIEEQHLDWRGVLRDFYGPFKQNLETAQEQMVHAKAEATPSEYTCPDCGKQLMYKFGKNGRFLSCAGYPDCKFACPCDKEGKMMRDEVTEHACPSCGKPMVRKSGRFGVFLGCSDYPNCKTTQRLDKQGNIMPAKPKPEPTGLKCYKCKQGELVIRQSKRGPFLGCNRFPKCRTIVAIKQLDHLKELQAAGQWPPATPEQADKILGRTKQKKTVAAVEE
jgi:DNA topoisomerase-1